MACGEGRGGEGREARGAGGSLGGGSWRSVVGGLRNRREKAAKETFSPYPTGNRAQSRTE